VADYPALQEFAEEIYTCNRTRCGFCSVECPVFRVRRLETYASRGRMLAARGLLEGVLEPSAELQDVMDECLMCGYCQARCALHNMDIFASVRQELRAAGFSSPKHEKTATKILEEGTLFDRPTPFRRVGTTPLYLGCAYQTKPHEVKTIVSVLEKVGIDPLVSDEVCCGYIVGAVGFADEFESAQARFRQVYGPHMDGEILGSFPISAVLDFSKRHTQLVQVKVPRGIAKQIASFRIQSPEVSKPLAEPIIPDKMADDAMVCLCERVSAGEVRELIRAGITDLNEIKSITRAGMGPCGGKTCETLINGLLKEEGIPPEKVVPNTRRPVFVEVALDKFPDGD